ncbi:hypothetical protein SDC9_85430 [bioreactor metagenome]|uniref:Uncharacterized protein n=1 Tax=bioreactor metagenome TaxID=1076179 RepID=A0A644ZD52_9ZZZZ
MTVSNAFNNKKLEGGNNGRDKKFFLEFLLFAAIYLGALSVVRNDIKKLAEKISDLEEKIENLNK